jgi:hypothetical protein
MYKIDEIDMLPAKNWQVSKDGVVVHSAATKAEASSVVAKLEAAAAAAKATEAPIATISTEVGDKTNKVVARAKII